MKILSFIFTLFFMLNVHAKGFLPIANVVKINGTAFIDKEKIEVGAEVAKGMEIKIPKKGDYIVVKFQNGHLVRFSEATVKIEELTEKSSLIHLIKGQLHTLVKSLTKDETFKVKTKYASFAVRGTKFGISIEEQKKKAYLCVCEGVVEATKGKLTAQVQRNEDLWVGASTKKLEVKPSTEMMFNMTNQMIEEMEGL